MEKFRTILDTVQFKIDAGFSFTEPELKQLWNDLSDAIAEHEQSSQAAVSGALPLVEALEQYIGVLVDELNELASMAATHGWKSSRVEIGEQMRNRIAELKRQ